MLVIIDYGLGNLRSVFKKFKELDVTSIISSDIKVIQAADKFVLPGVGHFKYGMENLKKLNIIDILNEKVITQKTPIFGICLGTQLFSKHSEEGDCEGLGWIDSEVVRFNVSDRIKYKVPHMGWNNISILNGNILNTNINEEENFYFVHSYHLICEDQSDIWMTTKYDYEFVSAISRDNIFGTQFHPEKSQDAGLQLLKNFVDL
ncbi:MAG TPA: imidazole glycerol phosphate synthase subunit HisH [Ignavibacteriaceae bacterium]|nr:imidazole glycerol phosphate synthase subunit HisH [Ignavibacteriaceae bacterium]